MSWIRVIHEEEAEGELANVYRQIAKKRGKLANIMRIQSLAPQAMQAHLDLYLELLGLTRNPAALTEKDLGPLRSAGLTDEEVLQTNMITAYFNFVNRIAEGLGVEAPPEEMEGYRY